MINSNERHIDYENFIEEKANVRSSDILPCSGPEHASYAISRLLDSSVSEVKMSIASLDGIIFDSLQYISSLKHSLERGICFRIIFSEELNHSSECYKIFQEAKRHNLDIEFYRANEHFLESFMSKNRQRCFYVFDDDKFFFQTDEKNYSSYCSFNNRAIANDLLKIFDHQFKMK